MHVLHMHSGAPQSFGQPVHRQGVDLLPALPLLVLSIFLLIFLLMFLLMAASRTRSAAQQRRRLVGVVRLWDLAFVSAQPEVDRAAPESLGGQVGGQAGGGAAIVGPTQLLSARRQWLRSCAREVQMARVGAVAQ